MKTRHFGVAAGTSMRHKYTALELQMRTDMPRNYARRTLILLLSFAALILGQAVQQKGTLMVKGYPGRAPVVQVNGKTYVEIESLARITNGALTFQTNQITLTLNGAVGQPPAAVPAEDPAKLSKDVLRGGADVMAVVGEWRAALVSAIQSNASFTDDWAEAYKRNADSKIALAAAAGATDGDRNVIGLLRNEFTNMQTLNDKYVAMRKSLSYVEPNSIENDPLNLKVQSCAQGLTSVTASGHFQDVATCH